MNLDFFFFRLEHCCSVAKPYLTFCDPHGLQRARLPSFTVSQSLFKPMSIESVMPSNHLILCRPFLLPPLVFPSSRVASNESALHIKWPKYWSFSINPSNEYSGLISFRIDWFDLIAVQGTWTSPQGVSSTSVWKHQSLVLSLLYGPTVISIHSA